MTNTNLQAARPRSLPAPSSPLPPPSGGLDQLIGESLFIFFRHKGKILLFTALGIAAAGFLYYTTPVVYRSEARLLVRYIAERSVADPAGVTGRVTTPDTRGANIIQSEIGILTSRDLVERVIDEMDLAQLLPPRNGDEPVDPRSAAIMGITANLQAQGSRNSNIILVQFDAPDPVVARDVLDRVTRLYLDRHVEIHRAGLAFDFLSQQTDQMGSRLTATERELQSVRAEIGIGDIDAAKLSTRTRIEMMDDQMFQIDTALAAAQARLDTLVKRLADPTVPATHAVDATTIETPGTGAGDAETASRLALLTSRLRNMREREMRLLATFTEESSMVQNLRRDIERLEAEWRQVVADVSAIPGGSAMTVPGTSSDTGAMAARLGNHVLDAMTDLAALSARRGVIERHRDEARDALSRIETAEARIRRLTRRRDIEEANYLYFSKNLEQARIDDALDSSKITNINIVQQATLPLRGSRPELRKRMGIALAAGLFAGIGLAFVTEKGFHARYFSRPEEAARALGIPVMVSIPPIPRRLRQGRQARKSFVINTDSAAWVSPAGFAPYCERLQHRIMLRCNPSRNPPVIGVTGCSGGSGVSTLASGIAMSIAREHDTRVLLTTTSLDSGAEVFANELGNITVMDWNRTVIGPQNPDTTLPEVTSPALRFHALLAKVDATKHGFVVVDMSPVSEQGKSLSFASALDGVVLVVNSEKDRRQTARHSLELLHETGVPVLGIVFNNQRQYVPRWLGGEI